MIPILAMRKLRGERLRKVTWQTRRKPGIEHYLVRLENSVSITNIPPVITCRGLKFQSNWTTWLSLNRRTSPAQSLVTADPSLWSALLCGQVSLVVGLESYIIVIPCGPLRPTKSTVKLGELGNLHVQIGGVLLLDSQTLKILTLS